MDMQQGAVRSDAILEETLASIHPQLHWLHGPSNDSWCTGPGAPEGTGTVDRLVQVLTVVSEQRRGNLLGVVERAWRAKGYAITSTNPSRQFPSIVATTPDRFAVEVSVGGQGQFFFSVTTPCFTRSAVPDPTTQPNIPQREGEFPIRPDIHDNFWSATTQGTPSP
ncbi:hypothetical protein [Streptomyces sp. NBC_00083]|uniref:hypothetical protein n=1 Tax=Streptomyces sp. NBC_00083 TaxID=2975647 RepID=UPI00224FE12D|nr:hypothetical protein [Streptomyces sp. NBC_00083]MCX5387883.1 hypothetical protein [Streptomyces sp. NBC_00083]